MELQDAIKTVKSLKSLRWFEYAGDRGRKYYQVKKMKLLIQYYQN